MFLAQLAQQPSGFESWALNLVIAASLVAAIVVGIRALRGRR